MREKKWTDGTWSIVDDYSYDGFVVGVMDEDEEGYYELVFTLDQEDEDLANAHLIAAAPVLVEALESILYYDERGQGVGYAEALERGQQALAKAYGEHHD